MRRKIFGMDCRYATLRSMRSISLSARPFSKSGSSSNGSSSRPKCWRNHAWPVNAGLKHTLGQHVLPNGLGIRHNSNSSEVMFLYEEVYVQKQYLQHNVCLKPGDIVLDVGSNIGLFSMLAAEEVAPSGCVVSVEPAPVTAAALSDNLQQHAAWCNDRGQQVARCIVIPAAVSDDANQQQQQLTTYKGASGWSTLVRDDAEVLANMQGYLQQLLEQSAGPSSTKQHEPAGGATTTAGAGSLQKGWSPLQQALVWCAQQLNQVQQLRSLSTFMATLYVKWVMLREVESVTVIVTTVSRIIEQQRLERVDLLKVDVERAELQVLRGIQQQHWPLIQQVAMEVHDVDGRLQEVVGLLQQHGLSRVVCEQPTQLQGTNLVNLYATRPQ